MEENERIRKRTYVWITSRRTKIVRYQEFLLIPGLATATCERGTLRDTTGQ